MGDRPWERDGPTGRTATVRVAFIYNVANEVRHNVVFPGSVSNTAYGIWHNGGSSLHCRLHSIRP